MSERICIFLLGFLITAGLHRAWFTSGLPVHVFKILRRCGWGKAKPWPEGVEYAEWLIDDFRTWCAINLHPLVAELLSCPVCFSYHLSFWIAAAMLVCGGPTWLLLAWPAWPELINLLPGHHD